MTETTEIPEATRRAMDKAKIALMSKPDTSFFSTVLFSLIHQWDYAVPTACTNGRFIKFNPDFFMKCGQEEQIGLMLHEVMHVCWMHMVRLGGRDHVKWNVACVEEHTPISMADGSTKLAKDVQVGEVLDTPFGPHPVLNRKDTPNREIMELVFANGYKLYCTPDHKILTEGGYLYAEQLEPGYHSCAVDAGYGRHTGGAPSVHGTQGNRHIAGTESSASIFTDGTTGTQSGPENGEEVQHRTADAPQRDRHGVLHRTDGRRGDLFVSDAQEGQPAVPSPVYQRDQHQPGFDGLVSGHGPQRYVGDEQQRQTMLEGTSQWGSDCSSDPAHAALRQDTAAEVRTDSSDCGGVRGTRQDPEPDTTHHEYVRGVEGIEYARLVSARRIAEKSSVIDFTTACQCFIAAGVVVHNCDYVINLMIIDRGFKLPKGALIDEQYRGLSAEEVYDLLPDPDPNEVEIHFEAGDPGDPSDMTAEEQETLERDIQDVLIRAQIQSKVAGDKPGTIPGEIELYLKRLLKPRLPTSAILRKFFADMAKNDYTWRRPNRRFFPKHHLPSMYSENLGHVAFFADLSASVTDKQVTRYISEVGGVMRQLRPKKLSLGAFDTAVRQVDEITSIGDLAKMGFKGRGGTEIGGVLEWAYQHDPVALVVFTDGGFYFHEAIKVPKCPVVWLINDNPNWKAPFGRVIHYDSD